MLNVEWVITEGEYKDSQITGGICLVDSRGQLTKNYDSVREWAKSWDGVKTDYFKSHFTEWEVELKIERVDREIKGEMRNVPEIKWVNALDSNHGAKIQAGDQRALQAKFGAKLKIAAANWNRNNASATDGKTAAQAPATPPPAEAPAPGEVATAEIAWDLFNKKYAKMPKDERNKLWFSIIARFTDRTDYRDLPAEIWEKVVEDINDDMPF